MEEQLRGLQKTQEPVFQQVQVEKQSFHPSTLAPEEKEKAEKKEKRFKPTAIEPLDKVNEPPPPPVPYEPVHKGKKQIGALRKEEIFKTHSDEQRLAHRTVIYNNTVMDLKQKTYSKEFRSTLQDIQKYSKVNVTAANAKAAAKERAQLAKIKQDLKKQLEKWGGLEQLTEEQQKEYRLLEMYSNYFELSSSGYLTVPEQESATEKIEDLTQTPITGKHTVWRLKKFQWEKVEEEVKFRSAADEPLFTHEPSVLDIQQGGLGDCYLLAALASIVSTSPQQIKECMKDNGDTVTVRFFDKVSVPDADPTKPPVQQTVKRYVTVKKEVPENDEYATGCLWVQLIERAYTASGLHCDQRAPNWMPSYEDIIGGHPEEFVFRMTGREETVYNPLQEKGKLEKDLGSIYAAIVNEQTQQLGDSAQVIANFLGIQYNKQDKAQVAKLTLVGGALYQAMANLKDRYWATGKVKQADGTQKEETYRTGMPSLEEFKEILEQIPLDVKIADGDYTLEATQRANTEWIRKLKDGFYQALCTREKAILQHKAFSGQYTKMAIKQYKVIEKAASEGKIITGGTQVFIPQNAIGADGKNAEHVRDGLAERHAYSILGVQTIGANRFVKLRNPWGSGTRAYFEDEKTHELTRERRDENTEGFFLMELNEFMSTFNKVAVN